MGRHCGYLALTSALATGAERVYLNEEGVTLQNLVNDVTDLVAGFNSGKRLGVMIRNELANDIYSTSFMTALFEEEGGDLFDVRQAILGHLQQGGDPTPFDRILATRLAVHAFRFLGEQLGQAEPECAVVGYERGQLRYTDFLDLPRLIDVAHDRPKRQWWLDIRPIARVLAQSGPNM
jgi:6-phosphofructokinase 1